MAVGRRLRLPPAVTEWAPPLVASGPGGPLAFRPAPGWLPAGRRVYAIGDVHGCAAALGVLLGAIRADLTARPVGRASIVLLGDYIDYGPDSAGVIDRLAAPLPGAEVVALRGDHEQMLLDALAGDAPAATDWLAAGGGASLASWGIPPGTPRAAWPALVPAAHRAFLEQLALSYRAGSYLFVHAGLRPGVALARQRRDDVLGIRAPFLSEPAAFGVVVVHGHSVAAAPFIGAARIGLDTGAGLGGALSCAVLEDERIACLTVPTPQGDPP
ncbi:MAG: serine/threonine protein phosphatase [Proteobacteria bacterium]|nr:serine/threonine protein phosphatase [Pseudomonadota bacterium]